MGEEEAAITRALVYGARLAQMGWMETLRDRIGLLSPNFDIVRPGGAGPFPLAVLLHGCGGRQPFLDGYAETLKRIGIASLIVDSHTPRRINRTAASLTVCTGARLQGRERAGDLFAAFAWARAQDWVDPNRLIAAGWSHGAWTLIDAMALRPGAEMARATKLADLPEEPLTGLSGAFLAYPYAGVASLGGRRAPRLKPQTTAIVCGRDYIVGTKIPLATLARLRAHGLPLQLSLFEQSTHAFECTPAYDPRVRYDPAATQRAHDLMRDLAARVT
jgi:dienelactone hydrolase